MENRALWSDGPGKPVRLATSPVPKPGEGQLLIRTKAVAVQPGEWKVQDGVVPLALHYPTIFGLSLSGTIEAVGPGVTRFAPGDRVACNGAAMLRDDARFGGYQRLTLVSQNLTSKIGSVAFEEAASLATSYGPMNALFLQLGLQRPQASGPRAPRSERVLIWGVSSSFGAAAAQLARDAGYDIVGVAAGRHAALARSSGVAHFVDRLGEGAVDQLVALGPFAAVLAAADSAADQVRIGQVLARLGGGRFLSTMGVRDGVSLPEGVSGFFVQYLDAYMQPRNSEFVRFVWWEYFEAAFARGALTSVPLEVLGGLAHVEEAWDLLRADKVSGKRLIIQPDRD